MTDNFSLMAHLVPRLTRQVENAATDALAYILNRSDGAMQALNDLLREGGFAIEPLVRVRPQVTFPDGSIPDMAGYDKSNRLRLCRSKVLALSKIKPPPNCSTNLVQQLSWLLSLEFLPCGRRWQMEQQSRLEPIESPSGMQRAKVIWTEPRDTEIQLKLGPIAQ